MDYQTAQQATHRNIALRALALIGWLLVFYIGTNILVTAIVGGLAGGSTANFGSRYETGVQAGLEFFARYGAIVHWAQIIVFVALACSGKFPGTGKYGAYVSNTD